MKSGNIVRKSGKLSTKLGKIGTASNCFILKMTLLFLQLHQENYLQLQITHFCLHNRMTYCFYHLNRTLH